MILEDEIDFTDHAEMPAELEKNILKKGTEKWQMITENR